MAERTVPWWRRALDFAWGGLRSGFGLFARTASAERAGEPEIAEELRAPEVEEALAEERPTGQELPAGKTEEILEESALPQEPVHPEKRITEAEAVVAAVPDAPSESAPGAEAEPIAQPETAGTAQETAAALAQEVAPEPVVEEVEAVNAAADWTTRESAGLDEADSACEGAAAATAGEEDAAADEQPNAVVNAREDEAATDAASPETEVVLAGMEAVVEDSAREETPVAAAPEVADTGEELVSESPMPAEHAASIEESAHGGEAGEATEEAGWAEEQEAEPEAAALHEPIAEEIAEPPAEPVEESPDEGQSSAPSAAEVVEAAGGVLPEAAAPAAEAVPPAAPEAQPVDEKLAAKLAARQKKIDEAGEESPFSVIVDKVYDGPLDLLLDLIRKQDIDIYDIPIAKITAQFLAYVNQLKASDVDVAGEFIYTASLLIHIKSRMLLPRAPSGPDETPEDPRRELVERLLEHERFKNAAQMLQQKQMLEAASWTNPGAREFKDDAGAEPEIAADTVDLVRIFRDILERARTRPVIDVTEDSVTVGQMIQFLARRLTMEDKPVALRRLLSHTRSERALIAMFLALLELVRLQAILLRQDRQFSEIFIKKNTGFDAVMNEGLANARDDWR